MRRFWAALLAVCLILPGMGWARTPQQEGLRVVFLDCGKADSILIQCGDYAALIDTATDEVGEELPGRLREYGVKRLDALIITHPHKDHIGGAEYILRAFEVDQVLLGPLALDTKQTRQFDQALQELGLEGRVPEPGETFALGEAVFTCLGPLRREAEEENDLSLVLRLDYGQTGFLFTGDIQRQGQEDLLQSEAASLLPAQVLKVPHHGGAQVSSAPFFAAVSPQIAVIPAQRGTEDNLPDLGVMTALEDLGAEILITDQGDVQILSDGQRVWPLQSRVREN